MQLSKEFLWIIVSYFVKWDLSPVKPWWEWIKKLDNNLFLILTRIVEHPAIHQSQLAELVQIDKTTLSRSLRKLEERGLIVKKTKAQNKKFKELYPLTPALKVYDKLIGYEDRYIQASLHQLTSSELFQLDHILQKIQNSRQEKL